MPRISWAWGCGRPRVGHSTTPGRRGSEGASPRAVAPQRGDRVILVGMSHVYGDSTPFPYDVDYIELSRHAVDCAVQLLSAQHAILSALERADSLNQAQTTQVARLSAMSRAVEGALDAFLTADSVQTERIAGRLRDCLSNTCAEELASIERQTREEVEHTRSIVLRSGESAERSLEAFLLRHDLPETELALTWAADGDNGYTGQVGVKTPFGVTAAFSLAIPPEHPWSRPRRVSDLAPGLEVHFPQQAGWLSKRVAMAPVKLDRFFLSFIRLDADQAEFRLRKGSGSGSGYRIAVQLHGALQVALQPLAEDGSTDADVPLVLDGEDSAQMFRLCNRVIESMQGLASLRRNMVAAELDAHALRELDWPAAVAERLIAHIGPVVSEISRRSGAPAELVLRRDIGGGRREEMYVTKADLYEKVLALPPSRRATFDVLGLGEPARAALAPANSPRSTAPTVTASNADAAAEAALAPAE